jgi:hypothetical protein
LVVILAQARIHPKRLDRRSGARQNPSEAPWSSFWRRPESIRSALIVILAQARIHFD